MVGFGSGAATHDGAMSSIDAADAAVAPADACTFGPFGPVRELAKVDSVIDEEGPWISDDADARVLVFGVAGEILGGGGSAPLRAEHQSRPLASQSRQLGPASSVLYIAQRASPADAVRSPGTACLAVGDDWPADLQPSRLVMSQDLDTVWFDNRDREQCRRLFVPTLYVGLDLRTRIGDRSGVRRRPRRSPSFTS